MPKRTTDFPEQINILAPEGVTNMLIAISYFRGEAGRYAAPARDFIQRGIDEFVQSLNERERRRFNEILENVKIANGGL